jgi:hypothetical protein
MSEPAKDEAELIEAIAWALWEFGCSDDGAAKATIAAIRAAGWAVVPVEPTDKMMEAVLRADWASHTDLLWADAYRIMIAAAPGVKP